MLLYSRDDLNYPLYVYSTVNDLDDLEFKRNELHVVVSNGCYSQCNGCLCSLCPIQKECSHELTLYTFFPQIYEDYPELTI